MAVAGGFAQGDSRMACTQFPLKKALIVLLLIAPVTLGACATVPTDPAARAEYEERNDPLEPMNRRIFAFNMRVERNVLRPVGRTYRENVPEFVRNRIRDFNRNFSSPVTFVNDLLQGKTDRAAITAMRFVVNSTAGMGGLFDVAAQYGLRGHTEDFGQTLAVWGVEPGPYLVLPLIGPSSVRHTVGRGVDLFSNPVTMGTPTPLAAQIFYIARGGSAFIDAYARSMDALQNLERNSVDFYAAMRSLYRQNRQSEIQDGRVEDIPLPGDDE